MMKIPHIGAALVAAYTWNLGVAGASDLVDPSERSDVVRFYYESYLPATGYEAVHGWTGSLSGCVAGSLSSTLHDLTIGRVNYFRAMAGLPAEITLSAELNAKCQQAALMMAYNNALSHGPPTSWACYTADGAQAAAHSNLSLAFNAAHYGPAAVRGQIDDSGAGNEPVAHRRLILSTRAPDQMGHGSIPLTASPNVPGRQVSSMALWVFGESTAELPEDFEFVAWPPAGFVPYELAFDRWSFGVPAASAPSIDFSNASVSMQHEGTGVPLTIVHRGDSDNSGDPTLVWEPEGFPMGSTPTADKSYTVTVSGITGAPQQSYTYQVTVIDANTLTPIVLDGRSNPFVGHSNPYGFNPIAAAEAYELRVTSTATATWVESVEPSPAPQVIDDTHPSYPLFITGLASEGNRSSHVLETGDTFIVDREIWPTASGTLEFDHRFRYVGTGTRLIAEVESSPGIWEEVWSRYGVNGDFYDGNWDTSWIPVSVPLAAYDGTPVRVRFRFVREGGPDWTPIPGDNPLDLGAFVDHIHTTGCLELVGEETTSFPAGSTSLDFQPDTTGEFWLQARAQVAGEWFHYGPQTVVNAVVGTPPSLEIVGTGIDPTGQFYLDVQTSGFTNIGIEVLAPDGGSWGDDTSFTQTLIGGDIYRFSSPISSPTRLVRVSASE